MQYPKDENWKPKRICYYPDGHRRWAELQHKKTGGDIENIRKDSYIVGAETCRILVDVAQTYGVAMVDIFLTRPSTYRTSIQDRTAASLISIHDAIAENLMKPLVKDGRAVRVYTRSDKPKYAFPEHVSEEVWDSWKHLTNTAEAFETSSGNVQVNLLINYDGYIDSQVLYNNKKPDHFLPITPSIDALLRTADKSDTLPHRISSGPTIAMAETSFVVIEGTSPELSAADISAALNRVVEFRRNKKHQAEEINL